MNKTLKYLLSLLFFIQISCQEKKDNKTTKNMSAEIYDWQDATSCATGYPIEVYKGGLQNLKIGSYTGLKAGITTGGTYWGEPSYGMSSGIKPLPDHLNVAYLSYAEDKIYQVDVDLDYKKLYELFKNGFDIKAINGSGKIRHENYNTIIVGFAPGGVTIVWVEGIGMRTEIGRYQGKEVIIPEKEIASLDSSDHLLFETTWRQKMMKDPNIIPLEIQKAQEGKPIPFGLWDTYRIKYKWKPVFELPVDSRLDDIYEIRISMFNGEIKSIFSTNFPLTKAEEKAIVKEIQFSYEDKDGVQYGAGAILNEESVFKAFEEVFGEQPESVTADLEIRVNLANTFFTVMLKGSNGKEVFIKTDSVEVFRRKQYK